MGRDDASRRALQRRGRATAISTACIAAIAVIEPHGPRKGLECGNAVTFEPPPARSAPVRPVVRLNTRPECVCSPAGLNGALVLTFDAAFASLTAEQFVTRILVGRLGIRGATIGFDFHFGNRRGGSPAFLAEQGERYGFTVETAPPLEDEGRPVSSSSIRAALAEGRVVEAAELLGYPWFGKALSSKGSRGAISAFPTANVASIRTAG